MASKMTYQLFCEESIDVSVWLKQLENRTVLEISNYEGKWCYDFSESDIEEMPDILLKASFQEGINIGDNDYLKNTVTELGLDWDSVKRDLNTSKWKKVLNDNVNDMYQGNCWGVPSFKITDADGSNPYYVWGQDRMWLLKEEINRRLT